MVKRFWTPLVSTLLFLGLGGLSFSEPGEARAAELKAFVGVTVLPMGSEQRLENHTVLVRRDRIVAIGAKEDLPVPEGTRVIQGRGRFLMPGLADMHVHNTMEEEHVLYLANGVTTVRNMWGQPFHLRWRQEIEDGVRLGPTIYTTGPIMDGAPPIWPNSVGVAEPGQAEALIRHQGLRGYDAVKVYSYLRPEVFAAVAATARNTGLPIVGHVPSLVPLEDAFAAGMIDVQHLTGYLYAAQSGDSPYFTLDYEEFRKTPSTRLHRWAQSFFDPEKLDDLARMTRSYGVWNTPTLLVNRRLVASLEEKRKLIKRPEMRFIPLSVKSLWDPRNDLRLQNLSEKDLKDFAKGLSFQDKMVRALREAGCDLLLGTDAPNPFVFPGFSIHEELELLVEAGLSPYEALVTGTVNPARFLGVEHEFGRVEVGLRADLVLLEADPLVRISNTRKVAGVMVRGRFLDARELKRELDKLAQFYLNNPFLQPLAAAPEGGIH